MALGHAAHIAGSKDNPEIATGATVHEFFCLANFNSDMGIVEDILFGLSTQRSDMQFSSTSTHAH